MQTTYSNVKTAVKPLVENHLSNPAYEPSALIDGLIDRMRLKNDAALSRLLEVAPPVISKIRHRRLPVGASLLLRMHEKTGMPVSELRKLAGIQTAERA